MWQEQDLRFVKRSLSRFEKNQIKTNAIIEGNALIFPGEPENELEELEYVGFGSDNIYCIERDCDTANTLHEYYYDKCRIFWENSDAFLKKTTRKFSYAHLDYCGQFNEHTADDICLLSNKIANQCFLRYTIFNSRKGRIQQDFESRVWCKLNTLLVDYGIFLKENIDSANLLAIFTFIANSNNKITNLESFFNLELLLLSSLKFNVERQWVFEYKEPNASNKLATCFYEFNKLDHCMGSNKFLETIEQLSLTPPYYIKGLE